MFLSCVAAKDSFFIRVLEKNLKSEPEKTKLSLILSVVGWMKRCGSRHWCCKSRGEERETAETCNIASGWALVASS